ncbi:DNA ligase [Arcobacter sp. YIC-464]|uniref:DNA ligase n=1 Tax=Arcobacter sp. YIC-464 TaxID=3376631 RepID=UPI003C175FBE
MRFFLYFLLFSTLNAIELQKPETYNSNVHTIKGWYMSEKLDGIRAFWDGKILMSKNGNKINAPTWFIKDFPPFKLDGELWTKRNNFENIQNIVLDKNPSSSWKEITYNIFEVPKQKGNFQTRLQTIKDWQEINKHKYIKIIPQIVCKDKNHLDKYLNELINLKAEGIILKNPNLDYFTGRNKNILKVKKFYDMEGLVIGINKHKNKEFKSLKIKLKNGVVFDLGGGFTNKQKLSHPKIGETITFKYYGFTKYKKPKFASFLRVRRSE